MKEGNEAKRSLTPDTMVDNKWLTKCLQWIQRSYESPYYWYQVVFKPFDNKYDANPEWFRDKSLDYAFKYFKRAQVKIVTREVNASKIHINALVCTDRPLVHGRNLNRHKLYVSRLPDIGSRLRVFDYMVKERFDRPFYHYKDYNYHQLIPLCDEVATESPKE